MQPDKEESLAEKTSVSTSAPAAGKIPAHDTESGKRAISRLLATTVGVFGIADATTPVANAQPKEPRPPEAREDKKPVEIKLTVDGERKRHNEVQIHVNLGGKSQQALNFDPSKADAMPPQLVLMPGTHSIDVQSRKQGTASTFRVVIDGKISTSQSAPFPLTIKGNEKVSVIVEEPVGNQKEPVKLDDGEQPGKKCPVAIKQPGKYYLPYNVDIYKGGAVLHSIASKDGKVPEVPADLEPGTYRVHIRPPSQHYPQDGRVSVVAGDKRADGFRQANLARTAKGVEPGMTEVVVKAGQTLEISVDEPTESYNQVMRTFKDVPVNVVFTNPYLASNNGPGAAFSPNAEDKFPNTILAIMEEGGWKQGADLNKVIETGSGKIAGDLSKRIAKNVIANKDRKNSANEFRYNHVVFIFGRDKDGLAPRAFTDLGEEKLAQELAVIIKAGMIEVMAKPHRTSDAMGIQGQANADAEINPRKKDVVPRHYTKADAITEYGPAYMRRWEKRKEDIKKEE